MNRTACAVALAVSTSIALTWAAQAGAAEETAPASAPPAALAAPQPGEVPAPSASEVIAKVGAEEITYGELSTMMNSSAVVGVPVPALGSADRQRVSIVVLDKIISANLLFLDAVKQGLDRDPAYQEGVRQFNDGILAALYRRKVLLPQIEPSEDEVQAAFKEAAPAGAELTDDARLKISSALRRNKMAEMKDSERQRIRDGVPVSIEPGALDLAGDAARAVTAPVATVAGETMTWGEVKSALQAASKRSVASGGLLDPRKERQDTLDTLVDTRAMAQKAKAGGMDQDPIYQSRVKEFAKTSLITRQRARLLHRFEPSEAEIKDYYAAHKADIAAPEQRKVQMVVLKTKGEADDIKRRVESGEITIHQAAADYSIDPRAEETLGQMDWVAKDTGFPELDALTFSLAVDAVGGPVESPAGWHLVKVLEIQPAQYTDIDDVQTHKLTRRRMMHERLDQYVVELRRNAFTVEVFQDRLARLYTEEAAWIAGLEKKAQSPDSLTKKRTDELTKLMQP
jgi:parvulin-like peptidyl-prolyl isomerase